MRAASEIVQVVLVAEVRLMHCESVPDPDADWEFAQPPASLFDSDAPELFQNMKPESKLPFCTRLPATGPQVPVFGQQKNDLGLQSFDEHWLEPEQPAPFDFF